MQKQKETKENKIQLPQPSTDRAGVGRTQDEQNMFLERICIFKCNEKHKNPKDALSWLVVTTNTFNDDHVPDHEGGKQQGRIFN